MHMEKGVEEYLKTGSLSQASKLTGIPRSTIWSRIKKLNLTKPLVSGSVDPLTHESRLDGKSRVYFLTSAQNNTVVHPQLWANMLVYAEEKSAEIHVSRYSYNQNGFYRPKEFEGLWYDSVIAPYASDSRLEIGTGLMWCGEMNTLPTASRPLSGFETYTGTNSAIFPHAKIAMQSIPTAKYSPPKFNYTTGTVTLRNYIQKRAGFVAEHHHCYGFLIVEVAANGSWKVRQVNATDDGNFQDLDVVVKNGQLTKGNRVASITWGDIHCGSFGKETFDTFWGTGGLIDQLKPKYQVIHDLFDGRSVNHHDYKNCHNLFKANRSLANDVEQEVIDCAVLLNNIRRNFCQTVIVDSNHDNRLERWLREGDYRKDHYNALYFLKLQYAKYSAIEEEDEDFNLFEYAINQASEDTGSDTFLYTDASFKIAGIEHGMHGHLGPNGSRGTYRALSKVAEKANIAHSHSAQIVDGLYVAGVCQLDHGYNKGPSSWSISHIITYPNGKRTIVTY